MSHPNLSKEINDNIAQSEKDGGIFISEIPVGCEVIEIFPIQEFKNVQVTKNS